MTPVIDLLTDYDSAETVTTEVEQIYEQFEYTNRGKAQYGDVLNELENSPDDLTSLLREQQQLVHAAVD